MRIPQIFAFKCLENCGIENTRPMSIDRYVCGLLATAVGANLAIRPEHLRVDFCVKSCELTWDSGCIASTTSKARKRT